MLRELEVVNFLSYEHETIKITPDATIAVVGKNGHGKSGLLEAILFCLYGVGREELSNMVRIGSDGTMKTKVTFEGVPAKAKSLVVERGTKKSGAGYLKVLLNDNLVASGGASPGKNKAQEYINTLLGVDEEAFMLTSFFGMNSNDSLMQVVPSARLETLQKLAGVDICIEFNKVANDYAKKLAQQIENVTYEINAMRGASEDIADLELNLKNKTKEYRTQKLKLEELLQSRSELGKEETRYQTLVRELDSDRAQRDAKQTLKEKAGNALTRAKTTLRSAKQEAADILAERKMLDEKLVSMKPAEKLREDYEDLLHKKVTAEATMALLGSAMKIEGTAKCPLCAAKLTEEKKDHWKDEYGKLGADLTGLKSKMLMVKAMGETRVAFDKKLEANKLSMKNSAVDVDDAEKELKKAEKELSVATSALETVEARIKTLKQELGQYSELVTKLESADKEINKYNQVCGSLSQSVKDLKERVDRCSAVGEKIKTKQEENATNTKKMMAYKTVADAFSRYAIPVQLLRNLRSAIERRATKIYQYFNAGVIRIDDVEGARPGVEFKLYDEMGKRSYKSLSTGEKVKVFLAVRVAITQIINANRDNKIEFLILDEIAGNLDAESRESLTRLTNSLLRKFFSQVFMVSHVDLRNIFDETVLVQKKNGVSRAEVTL